jgi:hypothetical protein
MDSNPPAFEQITHGDHVLAIIIRRDFSEPGLRFLTPPEFSQQLAYMQHPAGKVIDAHIHVPVPRAVSLTQEVLVIKRGKLRVDFYDDSHSYFCSRILGAGDVVLLAFAGHGFEVLEDLEMIEVKQGPYVSEADKVRFASVSKDALNFGFQPKPPRP